MKARLRTHPLWRIREGGDPRPSTGGNLVTLLEKAPAILQQAEEPLTVAQRVTAMVGKSTTTISKRASDVSLPLRVGSLVHHSQTTLTRSREVVAIDSLVLSLPAMALQHTKVGREYISDEGAVEGPSRMLIPMQGFFEWDCKTPFAEEEMGMLLDLQWATNDGEPIPINCMLPCHSRVFY